jgi:hypothetical protein
MIGWDNAERSLGVLDQVPFIRKPVDDMELLALLNIQLVFLTRHVLVHHDGRVVG